MASEEVTLSRIRHALRRDGSANVARLARFDEPISSPADDVARMCAEMVNAGVNVVQVASHAEVSSYLETLISRTQATCITISDALLAANSSLRALCDRLAGRGTRVVFDHHLDAESDDDSSFLTRKRKVLTADIGVTSADYGIADTGTLVLLSGHERHRLASLLPPLHVCVLRTSRIVARLPALLSVVRQDRFLRERPPQVMTFITGPSRSADIELTLSRGVHGPREVHALVLTDSAPGVTEPAQ